MANVYAVKTGNWSDVTVWNTGALPTSADDVYSNNFTVTIDQNVTVLSIRNESATSITAGGGFILNAGVTVNCTGLGIRNGNATCITFSSTGTSYINANITNNGAGSCVRVQSSAILYIVGNVTTTSGNGFPTLVLQNQCTVYLTGNVIFPGVAGGSCINVSFGTFLNITGDVYHTGAVTFFGSEIISNSGTLRITGNVYYVGGSGTQLWIIRSTGYLNIVGSISASVDNNSGAVFSNSNSAINIFTGPFISSPTGIMPIYVLRMHYFRTLGSYFEFRDETTDGALPAASPAPATRLVSPGTVVDAPATSDVRFGVVYASGSQTGTLRVPPPESVAYGVLTDNTTGSAILTAAAIWNTQQDTMTVSGSIGERLRNVATVQTTAAQIASF